MFSVLDPHAPKRTVNLSVNGDLLDKARDLDINLSEVLEQALIEALKEKQRERWLEENLQSIKAYNEHVNACGVFSDGLRR
ncbi:TPA: type II toxin-antitoxin system CcdA family antitoxin [Pseudomonas aeruginosa]